MTGAIGREWGGAVGLVADTRGRALHTFAAGANVVINIDAAGMSGRGRLGVVVRWDDDGVHVKHGRLTRCYSPVRAAWASVEDWKEWQRASAGQRQAIARCAVMRSRVGSA